MIRITRAYCIELERVVTADEARREFLSLDAPPKRFCFRCTEDRCRTADPVVRVTGAAYRTAAAESEKYVSAYFRRLDAHLTGCFWNSPENDDSKPLPGETAQSWHQRRARRKLTDFVDIFDPRLDNEMEVGATSPMERVIPDADKARGWDRTLEPRSTSNAPGKTHTSYLDKLVDTYLEAKSILTHEELRELTVHVVKVGNIFAA